MTYHAGLALAAIDGQNQIPHITCDGENCGLVYNIPTGRAPPSWLLNERAPRGWTRVARGEASSMHYCVKCSSNRNRKSVRPMQPIPISRAAEIARTYGYDQVVIIARRVGEPPEPNGEHVTTYGVDRAHCESAAAQGRALKKIMGWPDEETK